MKTIYTRFSRWSLMIAALSFLAVSCGNDDEDDEPTVTSETFVLTSEADGLASQANYNASTSTYTMTSNNTYILDGLVFVNSGQTLVIEPGTVIKARAQSTGTSALIVAVGATIEAEGTADNPIIFTSESDDLSDPNDLGASDVGLWGGVIILGDANISASGNTTDRIEGIESTEARAQFGGTNDGDNSGHFEYISIRHTGAELAPGDEIQALSLGGVGSGTHISYIDVYACSDDGVEVFGGTVDLDHISISFVEDDCLDWDQGWTGSCQFLFTMKRADDGNHMGEWDGAKPDGDALFSNPDIFNATLIGSGLNSTNADNINAILVRDGAAVHLGNSIIAMNPGTGIEVEDTGESFDSYTKMVNGTTTIESNLWFVGGKTTFDADASTGLIQVTSGAANATASDLATHLQNNNNEIGDPGLTISRAQGSGTLDPRASNSVSTLATAPSGLQTTTYSGAFEPGVATWLSGWSSLSSLGYLID